jgi:hypothetical protein
MVRNFFTVLGVASVFAVFFFFVRPDWIKQLSSSPNANAPGTMTKVNARLSSDRLLSKQMPTEKGGLLVIEPQASGEDHTSKIVEDVGEDLPSRNAAYLLVINKSTNSMRYCRLGNSVRKVTPCGNLPADVTFQEVVNTPGGPYQVIIWVPTAIDLQLEFDLMTPSPTRS